MTLENIYVQAACSFIFLIVILHFVSILLKVFVSCLEDVKANDLRKLMSHDQLVQFLVKICLFLILKYVQSIYLYRYVRCLGAMYLRIIGTGLECYKYLEPLYNDYRKIKFKNRQGSECTFENCVQISIVVTQSL